MMSAGSGRGRGRGRGLLVAKSSDPPKPGAQGDVEARVNIILIAVVSRPNFLAQRGRQKCTRAR